MKIGIKILSLGILLVLGMQCIFALGITPGRTTINYPNDLSKTFSFKVLNSENKNINISMIAGGDFAENIILEQDSYEFFSSESSKTFKYHLDIPPGTAFAPGGHKGKITILEVGGSGDDSFGAKLAVSTEIVFFIPYPFKYLEFAVDVIESNKNETTVFLMPIINRGSETIDKVNAVVEIYHEEEKINTVYSNSISLNSMERSDLTAEWKADVPLGNYNARVIINYDNEKINLTKEFKVGKISLDVFDLFIEDFELGSIVKMDILVENKWSEPLKEIYANLVLYNESGLIVDINSPPYDIDALSKIRLPLYWDTSGINKGKYYGKLIIRYKEFSNEKKLYVDISDYGIGLELESGQFVLEEKFNPLGTIFIILIIFVIILVILKKFIKKKSYFPKRL